MHKVHTIVEVWLSQLTTNGSQVCNIDYWLDRNLSTMDHKLSIMDHNQLTINQQWITTYQQWITIGFLIAWYCIVVNHSLPSAKIQYEHLLQKNLKTSTRESTTRLNIAYSSTLKIFKQTAEVLKNTQTWALWIYTHFLWTLIWTWTTVHIQIVLE